ncbi:phosphoribosylformylglycinamidine synthase subunit PurS [Alkalicoccus urumqiensis]|uniref:Phosphoribosylformylglycinamidine synthase subunit PurS n=1 Tax=Alkalicoccus urumqiensis TaxID=1548213 RepID=A0A2P6MIZ6_ALKUR|nr:phosphoribosylformylglycinamidine synthase subunit PurS [Alkalicoccus urumqiensis]PRO66255.1 phosphoribosylformylglycinamidine synthase [Alkalicoccus urumqiensis]
MTVEGTVYVTWKNGVLDPQGSAVTGSLHQLGYDNVEEVTISRMLKVTLEADSLSAAEEQLKQMSEQLLANPVIEDYTIHVEEVVSG